MRPHRHPVSRLAIGQERGLLGREIETKELHRFAAAARVLAEQDSTRRLENTRPRPSHGNASRSNPGARRKERQLLPIHSGASH